MLAERALRQGGLAAVLKELDLPPPPRPPPAGFDPLGLAADPEKLKWNAESERVHCRWAMLGVAGILAQVRS